MAAATGVPEAAAHGVPIETLYPELGERGLLARLRQVAGGGRVEVLAPALHKYLLPCPPLDPSSHFARMRQHVVMEPIRDGAGTVGVSVMIEDVTARFDRDRLATADLDSDIEAIRLRAATELAQRAEQMPLLSDVLGDDSWRVRKVAADGLATSDDRDVIATLVQALRDHHRNPALLNAALTALARTRQDIALDVVPLLQAGEADVRTYAALGLGLIGDIRTTAPLLAALASDTDANVRFHAIEALGRIGDRRAAAALATIANERDFFLAFPALDALAAIGDPSVATALLPLLDDELLAPAVLGCLGAIGDDEVVVPVVRTLDREGAPASTLARAVADISRRVARETGNETLIPSRTRQAATERTALILLDAIDSAKDDDARALILVSSWLPYAGVDAKLAEQLRRDDVRRLAAERLARRGASAAPFVEALSADADIDTRCATAHALGGISAPSSAPTLIAMLRDDPAPPLIGVVAAALGSIGHAGAFDALVNLLDHPEATARQAAIGALNSIAHPDMEVTVRAGFASPSPRVRESVARIAGYFTYDSCVAAVIAACHDDHPVVRRAAVESLATFEDQRARLAVRQALATDLDASVRAAAARALAGSDDQGSRVAIRTALGDRNLWVRYYAARAAARLAVPDADLGAALAACAENDRATPVRVAALEALVASDATLALAPLLHAVDDVDEDVASAALRGLGRVESAEGLAALVIALGSTSPRRVSAALDALAQLGPMAGRAVTEISAVARTLDNIAASRQAIVALGRIGTTRGIDILIGLGGIPSLFADVCAALVPDDLDRLRQLAARLPAAGELERGLLIATLARRPQAASAGTIATLLNDPSANVRRWASHALSSIDRRSVG